MASAAVATSGQSRFETVIGLEVHCQLLTQTKLFCACRNRFGDPPNSNVCPVCLGLPGALPVLSKAAVELAIRAALATGCTVHETSVFARKNYFYPDLPKGFQISQYEQPLATGGSIEIATGGTLRPVRLARIHMEEDAGKLLHDGFAWSADRSGVDFNRGGVPLVEIVSEPDLRSPEEAHDYLSALRAILLYARVSDCNMEQGSLRCDANVSVRLRGQASFGTRVEIKNLNSFRHVAHAIAHEAARQVASIEAGGGVVQETRLWDALRGETSPMRSKEDAHDYRYFPEPDLPPLLVSVAWIEAVRTTLPELPAARRARFAAQYALPRYDAAVLTFEQDVADYFEAVAGACGNPKAASNWVMTEVLRKRKDDPRALAELPVAPAALAELIRLVDAATLSGSMAKDVFEKMWAGGEAASVIVEREGLAQVSDEAALMAAIADVLEHSPEQVASYRKGKASALGWFVGQVMRKLGGKANPVLTQSLLKRALDA